MPRIIIEAVEYKDQRYDTLGDWYFDRANGDLIIRVTGADPLDQDEAFLIALHELVEAKLCHKHGVTEGQVDEFDFAFEADRAAGKHTEDEEPGDHPDAPYRREHRCAMLIEHMTALFLGRYDYGKVE